MRVKAAGTNQEGAALVEFALLAPLLFAIVLGIFSGGNAYNRKITMTDAVREGARFGATLAAENPLVACTNGALPAAPTSWCDKVRTRVVELSAGQLKGSEVCASLVNEPDTAGLPSGCSITSKPSNPVGVTAGSRRVVKVWAARTVEFEVVFFHRTLDLTSSLAARYERT